MKKEVRKQLLPMSVVLILLTSLGLWQLEFVTTSVSSNIFLNATIFGTFFFGVYLTFRNVFSLDNEIIAFSALQEAHDDAVYENSDDKLDDNRRYHRVNQQAITFRKPKIIEQPFHIISEEIARTGKLNLSTGVIQNILDSIDDRMDEKKSLVQYVTGILVFLGLIGTFVGLMVTLGSVGMIIGGIDLSGDGGPEAIQGLMTDLQIPLQGMATGFSSSLFGLITSLALGLMTRFSNQSNNTFRAGFETWLAGLANIGNDNQGKNARDQHQTTTEELSLMLRVARLSMISNAKLVSSVDNMAQTTQRLIVAQTHSENTNSLLANSMSEMVNSHAKSNEVLIHVANTLEKREELRNLMLELQADTEKQTHMFGRVNTALSEVIERQIAAHQNLSAKEKDFVLKTQLEDVIGGMNEVLSEEFSGLSLQIKGVDNVLNALDHNLGSSVDDTHSQLSKLVSRSNTMHQELSHSIAENKEVIIEKLESKKEADNNLQNASLVEQQRRLFEEFVSAHPDLNETKLQKPKKNRLSFFRRSA